MSTHFLSLINGWIWSNWGSGGPNPCGDSVKKTSTHFLNRLCGWIRTWGMDGVKPLEKGAKKMSTHFL